VKCCTKKKNDWDWRLKVAGLRVIQGLKRSGIEKKV
jgi:hypothetical protein